MGKSYITDGLSLLAEIADALLKDKDNIKSYLIRAVTNLTCLYFDTYNIRMYYNMDHIVILIISVKNKEHIASITLEDYDVVLRLNNETTKESVEILKQVLEDVSTPMNNGLVKGTRMLNELFFVYKVSMCVTEYAD